MIKSILAAVAVVVLSGQIRNRYRDNRDDISEKAKDRMDCSVDRQVICRLVRNECIPRPRADNVLASVRTKCKLFVRQQSVR